MRILYRPKRSLIPPVEDGCYGYLYNAFTISDYRELTSSSDWYVPDYSNDLLDLITYSGGLSVAGKLKQNSLDYWNTPNTGANSEYNFWLRGAGYRAYTTGVFFGVKESTYLWSSQGTGISSESVRFEYDNDNATNLVTDNNAGFSIRLVKGATGIPDGQQTTYTGNDGKIYPAIAINGKYWLQQNLEETQYRNGDSIANVTDNTEWSTLTTGAWCVYNNNDDYKCK